MVKILLVVLHLCGVTSLYAQGLDPLQDYRYGGTVLRGPTGITLRDKAVVARFKELYACPVTQIHSGACPGWAIDHVIPLACGGVDAVYNMQWLPNEIKNQKGEFSKDHFERRVYGGNAMSKGCP